MIRKWAMRAVIAYLLFGIAIFLYLFYWADTSIPEAVKGTSADPATFLNGREMELSEEYSRIRNLMFFLATPYEWLFYYLILIFGLSATFEKSAKHVSKFFIVRNAIYLFWLSFASLVIMFPLSFLSYTISKSYNISTQVFSAWMKDKFIDFWVQYATMFVVITVLYALMRKYKRRWWLAAWVISIPFSIFMMFIQPVVIDPLYNDFYPLKDKQLEAKILAIAQEANIPAEHVYEVDMSTKTNSLNAYVTGVGSNSRIVLWDTTLERLSDEEILFIMAHEMGHYVEKHIYKGIAGYLLLSFVGLWLTAKLMEKWITKRGKDWKVERITNISSLPAFLLITSILLFVASPITNWVSRYQETRADTYAINITHDKNAGIKTFQNLTKAGLSQVNPPLLVKIFRYEHPTMLERINRIQKYKLDETSSEAK
ncbi:M48 family metallopeptidase [Lederbergia wuyishanensis]|uniref:Zn-dependent protease with chaperone function n=1 Tax=Lederbergia wuyishanensis TaxID=1347903 RepID=A0ABU0CYT6_9BACI|nr:M48 family metallopeptidase [Lederbergia wuyishanensis]MCJ8005952.1 M48 family metallopeptidase [Lederbergia wuyishanensis]MDQ0341317.1 Zn-dependent protease with chaperone function [Lederbergia wuyishanensis]